MSTCFVIQPFDGGPFDKRYDDVIAPAIVAAGLEPYRVDRDPRAAFHERNYGGNSWSRGLRGGYLH